MENKDITNSRFLPLTIEEMHDCGIETPDFVYVIGDAYIDHPGFGAAIISRVLENAGFSVCIISQPDWHSCDDFKRFGRPRLGFLVTSGNIDSMVNHYTAAKKRRNSDFYSPGGRIGLRPDRADIVYCNRIREAYGRKIPIILGGIEASLRRFAHYDYWSDRVRHSILIDSGADLLIFGMGEHQIVEVASLLDSGVSIDDIKFIKGTVYTEKDISKLPKDTVITASYAEVSSDKKSYAEAFLSQSAEQDAIRGKPIAQLDRDFYIVQNPPAKPLTQKELDAVYMLPYMRTYHPSYEIYGGVPAITEVKFSLTSCRGCFGGCSFCTLTFHQGRTITSRSHESLIEEATLLSKLPDFKGYIHDVGGPTANFRAPSCKGQLSHGVCKNKQCLFPVPCKNLEISHTDYLILLRKLRKIKGVKRVFVRSGIRYDYLIYDNDDNFFRELCKYHISGQLKVAPEHISDYVLKYMGKPGQKVYERFARKFYKINAELGKKQFLVPYFMSSHPGSRIKDAVHLAEFLRDNHINPEQVQDFYPTPGSLSTCMYYTELDPRTMEPVYVPKTYEEKQMQRALLQYKRPENYELVKKALIIAKRTDLIGYESKCLIPYKPNKKGVLENGKNFKRKDSFPKSKSRTENRSSSFGSKRNNTRSGGGNSR